jgi:protein phosphatase 1 regulatory subunit 7
MLISSHELLQASDNHVKTLGALESELGPISTLETVYLEGNPCQKDDMSGYRRKVILALPQIKQLDAT